jgi:hypothetical protein
LKYSLGTPSLSSRGTITFTVVSRNEYSPICNTINDTISWSIKENSERGIIIGTISCRDDDKDEPNGRISVYPQWFPEEKLDNHNNHIIPFEITTKQSNTSEVNNILYKIIRFSSFFFF